MNLKERFMRRLAGKEVDVTPVGCTTTYGVVDIMKKVGHERPLADTDPKAMAGGISGALITTVLGLLVAIPTVLLHTIVNGRAQKIIHILDEQTTGIIAEHTEANLRS